MKHFHFFRLLSATALVIAFSLPTSADAKGHRHRGEHQNVNHKQRVEKRVEHMTKKLNLSEEQARQIRNVLSEKHRKLKEIRSNDSLSRDERRDQASEIHQQSHQKIHQILRPEQIKQIKEQRNAKFSKRAARQLEKLKVVLELSPKQVEAIKAIQAKHIKAKIALFDSNDGDRMAIKKALREQRKATRKAIREQLTAEQATKLDAMKRHRKHKRRHKYGKGRKYKTKHQKREPSDLPV